MKKILFPTDFSAASLNAFVYALRFASKTNAEIITLHVYDLPAGTYTDYYDYLTENYTISELGHFENFVSEVPTLRKIAEKEGLEHVKVSHMLENGNVIDTILSAQMTERADYIILGTKGATGFREVFLGSVAEEVINRATCMVLAIPETCSYHTIKNVLYLTEFEQFHLESLKKVAEIARLFKAHIDVLQVKTHHEEHDEKTMDRWKKQFEGEDIRFNILASNASEDTVLDFIELEHTHLIAMEVHRKNFFERLFLFSLSRNLAYHSKVPVLSIPKEVSSDTSAKHKKINSKAESN